MLLNGYGGLDRNMEQAFKTGDVVQLKSGGPKMTIDTIARFGGVKTTEQARCVWFDGAKRTLAVFELSVIELATSHQTSVGIDRA